MISSDSKQYKTRQRASSFNHSVTYKPRQRRPSYHVLSKKISTQIINTDTYSLGRTYFTNDSNSEGEDDIENISDYYLYRDTTDIDSNIEDSHNTDIRTFTEGSKITLDSTESSNDSRKSLPKSIEDRPPSLYPPRPIQPSQNKKRDQYGFLKGSQWITEEKFEEFESYYAPIVKRRHEKWKQLLKEHHQQWPPKSSKLKRYIRKGIPPELRGQAWLHYSGAKSKLESSRGLYEELTKTANELGSKNENLDIIERDLHRTFPENSQFKIDPPLEKKDVPMIQSLKRVLLAFSLYSPSIGYCQSLNYIAGILLLFMSEEEAFWTFVTLITEILPPNIYDVTMEGTNIDQNVLMHLISERHPLVWNKMSPGQSFWACEEQQEGGMPTCSLVTSHWFLTLYINILPIESVLRVWDCLFYEGQTVLFRVALGIFKLNESNILAVDDPLEVFQEIQVTSLILKYLSTKGLCLQNMPKRMIDCHQLIESTYQQYAATTRLKDEEIIDRRELFKERRDQRRRNIPVQNGRKLIKRGTVRGAIIHRAKEARWYIERAKSVKNKP